MMDFRDTGPGAVPLDMLRRYLVATGWHVRASSTVLASSEKSTAHALLRSRTGGNRNFEVFVSGSPDLRGIELVVPNSISSSEYASQVSRVIDALSAIEDRAELDVARSIREVAFDVLRSRIPDALVVDDSIRLEMAQSFVLGIRGVLAATAHTELDPLPYYLRTKKEASDYANRCRFGHTFRGSFGFTVESPIEPSIQSTLPGIDPAPPFERRVIQRLVRGLEAVSVAVSTDSTDPITDTTKTGFSANVCEQLAALVDGTSPSGIVFDFSFSPEWKDVRAIHVGPEHFMVGPRQVEAVREAAKVLRSRVSSWDETVFGRVIRLASQADPSDLLDMMGDREVAILWSSEATGDITVRASLNPAEYLQAVEAHAAGRAVEVSGTLERRGRRWVLLNPINFQVH
ncbi:hypothetical protein [Sphingobium sp. LMC3-1-1.1]|uniref:hypothetical protein n=1 Tax=unclassified Sphingobium TaxID=2611147 RepID=UPI003434E933